MDHEICNDCDTVAHCKVNGCVPKVAMLTVKQPRGAPRMEEKPKTFVQWKGTDLCMDLYCPVCAKHSHVDGMFAYHVRCPACRAVFKMPQDLPIEQVSETADMMILEGEL